jgi:hypothetical protein
MASPAYLRLHFMVRQTENMIATKSTKTRKEKQEFNQSGSCRFTLGDSWFRLLFVSLRAFL